ncbi:MAG TPA: hypothetical protein PLM75_08635, partial [bacterium]|nr:hypothetical protein [bacterium]
MFYNNTENIILFLANNNSEKAIIEYLNNRNTCFSENELQIASKLLFHKSPEIRYNFIKFIGRVKDYNLTTNLSAVINNENEKYYIQLEAISTLMKLSEKDEKIKLILKKAVTKLSSHHWQNKYIAKNVLTKDVFDIFIKSITEILQTLKIEITNHSMHQTKKLQLKNSLAISSYIFGDLNGSLVFNFDLTTAQTLLKKMYELNILKNGMIVNNQSLTKIFFELSILTNTFNKQISVNCQKLHNINLECMPAYFFNRQNIILSEKEDDTYLLKLQTNIGEINFGMIKHSNDTVINDFNEIAEFLKVDLVSANKIQIKCKTINFSIEGINIDNPLIMEHKIMVTKDIFQKIMNYYHIMLSECQTDKKTISQL